ncbi:MAG: PaaI family thioesterase [Deltaproteobacteria bacterium]|nr:PaaI family thioesterase [Deltaproteobacteria bacterium]MBW2136924.1 PaaI family thioesterase [Deltaproteobacteria bacterium]
MAQDAIEALTGASGREPYARKLGMRLVALEPGRAVVEMQMNDGMKNIFGMIHGGAIFSLIDEAFQASCNSHGRVAVALNVSVTYHRAPKGEGKLVAESREVHCSNRTGTYEIRVTDEDENLIASCLALAYRKGDPLPFLAQVEKED